MASDFITVRNFSKNFGSKTVVSDLSFDVSEGEVFAFLGANGSGKTTTIRCLLGLMQPTSGSLLINGKSYNTAMAGLLGYLPEERGLYTSSNVLETMVYIGVLKGLHEREAADWSRDYLQRVGLADKSNERIGKLSSGEQQKVQLGSTIINKPKLLVLDEPTKGLDPVNRSFLMDILLGLKTEGSTIVFITHQMEEVEEIADRLLMIKDGKKVLYGAVNEVKAQFGEDRIHVTFSGIFPKNDKLYSATVQTNTADLKPKEGVSAQDILRFLAESRVQLVKFEVALPSLQEVFVMVSTRSNA
jgi:ABC-2 type transport system ATP-binding protein